MASHEKDRMKQLIREMECPICMEYMTNDIYQCENGHNICGFCNRKIKGCPYCTLPIIMRNRGLEKLSRNLSYPCKYPGCNEAYCMDELKVHQSECPFGPFRCPMSCSFMGVWDDLQLHLAMKHADVFSDLAPDKPLVNKLLEVRPRSCWDQFVMAAGSVFFCSFVYSEDTFYGYVKQIGPPPSQRFGYEMSLVGADNKEVFTLRNQMHRSSEAEGNIIKSKSCLTIGKELLQRYLDDSKRLKTTIILRADNTQVQKNLGAVPKANPKMPISTGAIPKHRPEKPITPGAIPKDIPANPIFYEAILKATLEKATTSGASPKHRPEQPITSGTVLKVAPKILISSGAIPKVKPQKSTTSGNASNVKETTATKLKKSTIFGFSKKKTKEWNETSPVK